jgi:hypothetical protein
MRRAFDVGGAGAGLIQHLASPRAEGRSAETASGASALGEGV